MRKFAILLLLPAVLVATSCKKKKLLKDADGSYSRELPNPRVYSDSSTQVLFEASIVSIDRKAETFKWDGFVAGSAGVKYVVSPRSKSEIEMKFNDANVYDGMIPASANPNYSVLNDAKFYLRPNGSTIELSVVVGGAESVYVYTEM